MKTTEAGEINCGITAIKELTIETWNGLYPKFHVKMTNGFSFEFQEGPNTPEMAAWAYEIFKSQKIQEGGVLYEMILRPIKQLCCERDHDQDGNCDRHPNASYAT